MSNNLNGKVALVTGGTGGIGTAICRKLASLGATVVACDLPGQNGNEDRLLAWKNEQIAAGFKNIEVVGADVSQFNSCSEMATRIKNTVGNVNILVNNAGITMDTTFRKMSPEQWNNVMGVNLDSMYNVSRQFIDDMMNANYGRIINISSVNGQKGQFGQVNYSSSKAAILGFTKALAQEVAKKGVTVNSVTPGYIGTQMVKAMPENVLAQIVTQIPVGRLGTPEEVAHVIAFLCDDNSGFLTGSNIAMNGGQHMF